MPAQREPQTPPRGAFGDEPAARVPTQSERAPKGTYAPVEAWEAGDEALALTVPPGERPSQTGLPGSIEEAVLQMLEQVPASARPPRGTRNSRSTELPLGALPPPPPPPGRKIARPR